MPANDDVSLMEIYDADSESEDEQTTTLDERLETATNSNKEQRNMKCGKCSTVVNTEEQLKHHNTSTHKLLNCSRCSYTSRSATIMKTHTEQFYCKDCAKMYFIGQKG